MYVECIRSLVVKLRIVSESRCRYLLTWSISQPVSKNFPTWTTDQPRHCIGDSPQPTMNATAGDEDDKLDLSYCGMMIDMLDPFQRVCCAHAHRLGCSARTRAVRCIVDLFTFRRKKHWFLVPHQILNLFTEANLLSTNEPLSVGNSNQFIGFI